MYGQDYVRMSSDFLQAVVDDEDTQYYQDEFAQVSMEDFIKIVDSDREKMVFWINIYNGYIQLLLRENPDLYTDRSSFFSDEKLRILRRNMSFSDIEHGILRHSKYEYSLGYITNPFAPKWERTLRVEDLDYRLHFGLNCGAKSCPPVRVYHLEDFEIEIDQNAKQYLMEISEYTKSKKRVATTALFSWFRGDFGGKQGVKTILKKYGVVRTDEPIRSISYKDYDWTLTIIPTK